MNLLPEATPLPSLSMATTAEATPSPNGDTSNTTLVPYLFPWEAMPYEIRDKILAEIKDSY